MKNNYFTVSPILSYPFAHELMLKSDLSFYNDLWKYYTFLTAPHIEPKTIGLPPACYSLNQLQHAKNMFEKICFYNFIGLFPWSGSTDVLVLLNKFCIASLTELFIVP